MYIIQTLHHQSLFMELCLISTVTPGVANYSSNKVNLQQGLQASPPVDPTGHRLKMAQWQITKLVCCKMWQRTTQIYVRSPYWQPFSPNTPAIHWRGHVTCTHTGLVMMSGYLKTYFVMYDDVMSIELGSQPQHQGPRDEPNLAAVPTKRLQDFESSSPHLTEVPPAHLIKQTCCLLSNDAKILKIRNRTIKHVRAHTHIFIYYFLNIFHIQIAYYLYTCQHSQGAL